MGEEEAMTRRQLFARLAAVVAVPFAPKVARVVVDDFHVHQSRDVFVSLRGSLAVDMDAREANFARQEATVRRLVEHWRQSSSGLRRGWQA